MVELWIPITIGAVIFQTIRTGMQKHLKGALTTSAVTYVRFLFGLPIVVVYLTFLLRTTGQSMPSVSPLSHAYGHGSHASPSPSASVSCWYGT